MADGSWRHATLKEATLKAPGGGGDSKQLILFGRMEENVRDLLATPLTPCFLSLGRKVTLIVGH